MRLDRAAAASSCQKGEMGLKPCGEKTGVPVCKVKKSFSLLERSAFDQLSAVASGNRPCWR